MGRQQRKTTLATAAVLQWLRDHPDAYGTQISKHTHYAGGTIYPILLRLELQGWVESSWEEIDERVEGRRRRRLYRLTEQGQHKAETAIAEARRLLGG